MTPIRRAVARILLGDEHLAEQSKAGSYPQCAAENFEDLCTYFVI